MRNRRFAAFAAAIIFLWPAAAFGAAPGMTTLAGHVPAKIRSATRLARLAADEKMDLHLTVKLDQALMDQTMAELYGPNAPANKHFLTPAEFALRFDLARKRQALKDFAAASGLTVDAAADEPSSLLVKVSGRADRVENALGIKLYHYRTADGRSAIGHETEPSIPSALAPHLQSIIGLSNFRGPRKPHLRFQGGAQTAVGPVRAPGDATAAPGANPRSLTGTTGPYGLLAPADIDAIYGLTPSATAGAGQVTALLELDGYDTSDVTVYESQMGISPGPTVTFIGVGSKWDGTGTQGNTCGSYPQYPNQDQVCSTLTGDSGQSNTDGSLIEVALDIDMMLALAPGATQLRVYTAFNSNNGAQELEALQQIATDNVAKTISTSWGLNEADVGGAYMASENAVFFQMSTQGQSMFAASGDDGAYDNARINTETPVIITDDPAAQPYVTGVGGTVLSGSISSHSEAVWNEGCAAPGTNCTAGSSGGGIDNYCENGSGSQVACPGTNVYWPLPSYQSGVAGTHSQTYRNVPDVTLNADPNSAAYAVILVNSSYPIGGYYAIGGTSAAAPLWAAMTASINHNLAAGSYSLLGFANPSLYKLGTGATYGNVFNDITSGGNGAYSAGTGYDNASGWGSFKGNAMITALGTPLPPTAAVSNLAAVTLGMTSIQYTWTGVAGATGYDVYYSTGGPTPVLLKGTNSPYTQSRLIGDEPTGIIVYGENQGIEGPGSFITTATYTAAPAAPTIANVWSTSATFTYSACPAFPANGACSGYELQVSVSPSFTGTVFTSSTPTRTLTTLGVTGLASLTGYYARLANLNTLGGPAFGGSTPINTVTNLVAPTSPTLTSISTGSIVFGWGQTTNPGGILYVSSAATSLTFAGALSQTGTALDAGFTGLTADTSYYFQVAGVGGPWLIDPTPVATLALAPGTLANAYSGVGATAFTLSWSGANDQPDTLYQADISQSATFASGVTSQQIRSPTATFGGLTANTPYYARVKAIGREGGVTAEVPLGSTTTLVLAPTLPAQPFSGQTTNAFTFTFNATDPAGTNYMVQIATTNAFTTVTAAANTTSNSASFAGLLSNQYYDVQVAALNGAGSPSAFASLSTVTLAAVPLAAAVPVTTFTATTFGFAWIAGTLTPGTTYIAQVSSSPVFSPGFVLTVSTTESASEAFAGLQTNTTYYGEVQAKSADLSLNPNSPFLAAAIGSTLPNPPIAAAIPFLPVSFTSETVAWQALPLAPQSLAAEGYIVQFATSANFTTITASSQVPPGATAATVSGLNYAAPYFARVGALNWEGAANFLTLGSTKTALPPLSSGTVATGGIMLNVPQAFPQVFSMNVLVPPAAFPAGTPLSAVANLTPLPPPVTNEASSIVPFGTNLGIVLSANGLQPNSPVTITMAYDFTQIPAGESESRLSLWRYDPNAGQWTLVPSNVSTAGHVLTAQTSHFSTFAPFFVAAGSDVSSVQVWPQPWELGDASSQYFAPMLNFSNLPASATAKIYTITGELVWSGTAAADGTLNWNGNNRFGRHVASGTYYCTFQNGGQTKTRRLVIIR